jgi:hypothetical protein
MWFGPTFRQTILARALYIWANYIFPTLSMGLFKFPNLSIKPSNVPSYLKCAAYPKLSIFLLNSNGT